MLYREIIAVCPQIHTKHIHSLCGQNVEFLGALTELRKATDYLLRYVCRSVRVSAWNNSVPTGRIFMKFYISVFVWKNLSWKSKFS